MNSHLVLIILAVSDLPRALAFYRAAFGWDQIVDVPVYAEFRLPDGLRLGLYDRQAFAGNTGELPAPMPAGALAPTELYLHSEDARAAGERLAGAGARLLSPLQPRAWGDLAAYYADPEGNVIVVAQPAAPG